LTEAEWLECDDLFPMLVYLRGEIEPPEREPDPRPRLLSHRGDLVFGDGQHVSALKLANFAREVCKQWWKLPLGEWSRRLVLSYQRFLEGEGTYDEFVAFYSGGWSGERPLIQSMSFGWPLNPFGMAGLAQNLLKRPPKRLTP